MRFRILGPLEVRTGQDWAAIGASKWRSLLAVLLLSSGQLVSADRLIAELWGDDPPDSATNLLSVYVLRLRRLLDDAESRVLTTRPHGYQLRLDPDDLDSRSFEELVVQGRQVLGTGDPQRAATVLTEALGLWRGSTALVDVPPSAFVTAEAGRLEELRLSAFELHAEARIGCGLQPEVIPGLRRLVSDHPLREELWALLMRALDGAGRQAEAVATYGQAREAISAELGVDPGPELQQLYQAILKADALGQGWRQPPGSGPAAGQPEPAAPSPAGNLAGQDAGPAAVAGRPWPRLSCPPTSPTSPAGTSTASSWPGC